MTKFNIEIVSDTICPWCYVGKKKLEKAIEAWDQRVPGDTFSITWNPFYLNPDSPKVGMCLAFPTHHLLLEIPHREIHSNFPQLMMKNNYISFVPVFY